MHGQKKSNYTITNSSLYREVMTDKKRRHLRSTCIRYRICFRSECWKTPLKET